MKPLLVVALALSMSFVAWAAAPTATGKIEPAVAEAMAGRAAVRKLEQT